ncbi:MAG: type II toxin-antitoxin system HicA family toxin [Treponema sp.]|nr:type II toxin-antitoxin system HicA family toxin [Treponema sp.]
MKRSELLQKLKRQGAVLVRHGAKHDVYIQPGTGKEAAVPRHDEINEYTAKTILKKLS